MSSEVAKNIPNISEETKILARFPAENPNPVLRIRRNGTIAYANPGSEPLLKAWSCGVGGCLPNKWNQIVSNVFGSGNSEEIEIKSEDQIFIVSFLPVADASYIYAYGRDITERKRMEEALRRSEEMYKTIFETTGSAAMIVEENTTIFLANTEFEKLSGFSREDIEGKKSWTEFVPESSMKKMEQYRELKEENPDTAPKTCETQLVNKNGEIRECLVTASTMPATGRSIVFVVDITERKEETERIQTAKMRSLRELVAGLAHKVNNPTATIASNNNISGRAVSKIRAVLAEEYPQEVAGNKQLTKTLNILDDMNRVNQVAAEDIAKIVVNLQRFVKLDEAEWQITDIHEGIDNVLALMQSEFPEQIKITRNYGQIPKIYCSPSSINQVIMSLLKNASEAIVEEGEINITTSTQEDYVRITISDTGIGIPMEYIDRIFEPGFTTKGANIGVGLGLPICYKIIVDEHKGHINATSEPGIGSVFTITLPYHQERIQ